MKTRHNQTAGFWRVAGCISALLLYAWSAHATPGSMSVYRDTGTNAIDWTATGMDYSTIVREDSGFSHPTSSSFTLDDAGHYLVLYNIAFESSSGPNRSVINANLDLNGTDLGYGRSQGYIRRRQGVDEAFMSGGTVLEVPANSTLKVEAKRTDSNNSAQTRRRANESGLSLLQLDDGWAHARTRDLAGGQGINSGTFQNLNWNIDDEMDTGISRSGSAFTLSEAGHYLVTCNVFFHNQNKNRRNVEMRATLNNAEINGSRVSCYIRGQQSTVDGSAAWVGIIEATSANQILRMQARQEGQRPTADVTTVGGSSGITITKLPDSAQFIRLDEAGGFQRVQNNAVVTWDQTTEEDSSFTHDPTNTERVTINTDGDYLFFSTMYAQRTPKINSTRRMVARWRWRVDGTDLQWGTYSAYSRGKQGNFGKFTGGNSGGVIMPGLSSSQYIDIYNSSESSQTDTNFVFIGDRLGFQGVRIATLFSNLTPNASSGDVITPNVLCVGAPFTITTTYQDFDGYADIDTVYLTIDNPNASNILYSTSITGTNGAGEITHGPPVDYASYGYIATGHTVRVIWSNMLSIGWAETTNLSVGVRVVDKSGADSGWSFTPAEDTFQMKFLEMTRGLSTNLVSQLFWSGCDGYEYDLLYTDNILFDDSLTNDWELIASLTASNFVDTGGGLRPAPNTLNQAMRFYRVAYRNRWQPDVHSRSGSEEVYLWRNIKVYEGQNWISLPGIPDIATPRHMIGHSLPAGTLPAISTRISWYEHGLSGLPTQQIYLATGPTNSWHFSVGGSGSAENLNIDYEDGFILELPPGSGEQQFEYVGLVPTNKLTQPMTPGYNLISTHIPRSLKLNDLNLVESGMRQGSFPPAGGGNGDILWKFDRQQQLVPQGHLIWYSDGSLPSASPAGWYYTIWDTTTWRAVPEHLQYLSPDDSVAIYRPNAPSSVVWTNKLIYTTPTRSIDP